MKLTRKKIISLMITLCLMVTMLPATAFADDTPYLTVGSDSTHMDATKDQLGEGWSWVAETQTFSLSGDVTGNIFFRNLAGDVNFIVSGSPTINGVISCTLQNQGKLKISGSGKLTISYLGSGTVYVAALIANYGMEISDATVIVNNTTVGTSHGVAVKGAGGFLMSSGELKLSSNKYGIWTSNGGDIEISGTAKVTTNPNTKDSVLKTEGGGNILIGGNAVVDLISDYYTIDSSANIIISGGTITTNRDITGKKISITGGKVTLGTSVEKRGNIYGNVSVSGTTTVLIANGDIKKYPSPEGGNLTVSDGAVTITGAVEGNVTVISGIVSVAGSTVTPSASDPLATDVTFTATQTGGNNDTANSTGIVLTFSKVVTGLTAEDVTITNNTGSVTKGALSGSGATYTISLTGVGTKGNVIVSVKNFGLFYVMTASQNVEVYKVEAPAADSMVIGGVNVSDLSADSTGTNWSWSAVNRVLTLTGDIAGNGAINFFAADDVTVTVNSNVKASLLHHNRGTAKKLTINGSGELTINYPYNDQQPAIYANEIEISSVKINVNTTKNQSLAVHAYGGDFTMSSGVLNLSASGNNSGGLYCADGNINISGTAQVKTNPSVSGYGLQSLKDIIISGNAVVDIVSTTHGIKGKTHIQDGTVSVKGAQSGSTFYDSDVTISGGTLTTGTTGLDNGHINGNLTVSGITTKVLLNGSIKGAAGNLTVSNGEVTITGTVAGSQNLTGGIVWVKGIQVFPKIDITDSFTDANFLANVYRIIGKTSPAAILVTDVENIIDLYIDNSDIASLAGIEHFKSLKNLICYYNKLTELDVSSLTELEKLHCSQNKLTALDVSNLTKLTELNCNENDLTELDLSALIALEVLNCQKNQLTKLDVSKLTSLIYLICDNNHLTELDARGLTALEKLYCQNNRLDELDVSGLTKLKELSCSTNKLSELDLTSLKQLTLLWCNNNQLTKLNVMDLSSLTELICYENQLTELNINNLANLKELDCHENSLSELDVSGLLGLENLSCSSNQLITLNLTNLAELKKLNCTRNQLNTLIILGLTKLEDLSCAQNRLTSFEVTWLDKLTTLSCNQNYLATSASIIGLNTAITTSLTYDPQHELGFKAVTNIIDLPMAATINIPLTLAGIVIPAGSNRSIEWSVIDAGTTGAIIIDNILTATTPGAVKIKATIKNGQSATSDYVKNFVIDIEDDLSNLENLKVEGYAITPVFQGYITKYTLNVPYNVSNVTVSATAVHLDTAEVTGTGSKSLLEGSNPVTVTVTSANKVKKYKINIIRDKDSSSTGSTASGSKTTSSGNTTPVIVPPYPTKPNTPTIASTEIKADSTGNVSVSDTLVADAILMAQAAAKKANTEKNGIAVEIKIDSKNNTPDKLATLLTNKTVTELVKSGVKELRINSGMGIIKLDLETLKTIQNQIGGSVKITMDKVDNSTLTAEARTIVGNRTVFEFNITGEKGQSVTKFGKGRISVALPYTLGANEKAENIVAYYIDKDGKAREMANSIYDEKTKTLNFVTDHFSTFAVGYKANKATTFHDITNHWAKGDIEFLSARGLFSGTGGNAFSPDRAMTRGMFVTVLGRLAKADVTGYKKSGFADVKSDAYYMGAIEWANKNGMVKGISQEKFAPNQAITREQMVAIMANYAEWIGFQLPKLKEENIFADNEEISGYAKKPVEEMQLAGLVSGKNQNKFDPKGPATRAEVSAACKRFVDLVEKE